MAAQFARGVSAYRLRLISAVLVLVWPALAFAQGDATKGTVTPIKVRSAALTGNLAGENPERDVYVYLPPGYETNRNQRYPVVYLLHGFGLTAERWMSFAQLAATADKAIAAGTMRAMILVNPDAYTANGGSMYSSSPTIGDWETFIAEDLVAYIDKTYRTLASRESRGLAGHSMGGYGTLRIGMKRPDVFSSLYPMSSCCLIDANITGNAGGGRGRAGAPAAGAAPAPGAAGAPGARGGQPPAAASAAPAAAAPATQAAAAATPATPAAGTTAAGVAAPGTAPQGGRGAGAGAGRGAAGAGRGGRGGGFGNVNQALAAAWAPNPKNPPNYFDLPVVDGQPQPLVIAKFAANSPFAMLPQYVTNMKKYKAIMLDVGLQDGLAGQNRQLVEWLENLGIPHTFETYEGDHSNKVVERLETRVLPFFTKNLSFAATK